MGNDLKPNWFILEFRKLFLTDSVLPVAVTFWVITALYSASSKLFGVIFFSTSFKICHPYSVKKGLLISPFVVRLKACSSKAPEYVPTPNSGKIPPLLYDVRSLLNAKANESKEAPLIKTPYRESASFLFFSSMVLLPGSVLINMTWATFTVPAEGRSANFLNR